jgi:3-oxoacyl-[acyl-carrier protein] reductase
VLWEGDRGDDVAKAYPMKRLGEPADVGAAALYLADDESSGWITGQTIVLDGGGIIAFSRVA